MGEGEGGGRVKQGEGGVRGEGRGRSEWGGERGEGKVWRHSKGVGDDG